MKKLILPLMIVFLVSPALPAFAFLDYLFSGSSARDAIDNSAIGDLRAWWTGNPAYQFNPYYTPNPVQSQGQGQTGYPAPQMSAPQYQQPGMTYYPPQPQPYGQPQAYQQVYPPQPVQQQYQYPQAYQQQAPQYQQQYQLAPQGYQGVPQQYQQTPQQYQMTTPQY